MKKYLKVTLSGLVCVLAMLLPLGAWADTTDFGIFHPSLSDKSVSFLAQIFGNVGNVLHGVSGSLLSEIFRVFNAAILTIAGFYIIYTTAKAIFDTAQDGEGMGKKMGAMVAIRSALSIGIMAPKFTGYSAIQVFVMWVVVQGVWLV